MGIIEILTPKDTEEVKPGLFIQKKGNGYRMVSPAAWNGKLNWKNIILGPNWLRNFIWFAIIMFICWSYVHDNAAYENFYEHRFEWCYGLKGIWTDPGCSVENFQAGLCYNETLWAIQLPNQNSSLGNG